jgi:hypothetical protein
MESALSGVKKYYEAFDAHRDDWQALVADDINFVAPLQRASGKTLPARGPKKTRRVPRAPR